LLSGRLDAQLPQRPIEGKWTDVATGLQVDFKHDGTVLEVLPSGGISEGTYAFTDDNHIRVQPAADLIPSGAYVATVVITGNQMQFFTVTGDILKSYMRGSSQASPTPSATPSPTI
jgi:hypothetical protein